MKLKTIAAAAALGLAGMQVATATAASAHDAPPLGIATCATDGTWQVTDGHATTENTGGSAVTVAITADAGTVSQSPSATTQVTGDGKVTTFSIRSVPLTTKQVTVTSTTRWGTDGVDVHTAVVKAPADGCVKTAQPTVPILSFGYCESPGVVAPYTLEAPITEGVAYTVFGDPLTSVIVPQGTIAVVTASPLPGYVLDLENIVYGGVAQPDGTITFTWDTTQFGPDCGTVPTPTTPSTKAPAPVTPAAVVSVVTPEPQPAIVAESAPTLANTGASPLELLALAAIAFFVGLLLSMAAGRR